MSNTDKPIKVYNKDRQVLSHCSRRRAGQMVQRRKAEWIGQDQVLLLITKTEQKEMRRRVRLRDKDTCYLCGEPVAEADLTYDHIVPRSRGGEESEDNLACCHRDCNEIKADLTLEELYHHLSAVLCAFALRLRYNQQLAVKIGGKHYGQYTNAAKLV